MFNLIIGTKPSTSKKNLPDESDFDKQHDHSLKQSSDDSVEASQRQILSSTSMSEDEGQGIHFLFSYVSICIDINILSIDINSTVSFH